MEIGIFLMPAHPPERSLYDATQWDLDIIELADQLGYVEAWVGEHFTVPWEPICAPDLLLAQALLRTKSHQARARRAPVALSPPGRIGPPRGLFRPPRPGPLHARRRRQRHPGRLGAVRRGRQERRASRDDPRSARDHVAHLDRGRTLGASRKVLERQRNCADVRRPDEAPHQALTRSRTRRSASPGSAPAPRPSRWPASAATCR